ncbi:CCN family member 1-like [Neosynchiropus ocellatus]
MTRLVRLIIVAAVVITQGNASCPARCECPPKMTCPAGVSYVPDGCGCCNVCAAQLNQDCSPMRPCDHHKGLECNFGNDVTTAWGICRARSEGRSCEYNGRIYQNGESFQAGCKHQCTCVDGSVGCSSLCENKLPPASEVCPNPRLIKIPGQCCFSVDCHQGTWRIPPKHLKPSSKPPTLQHLPAPNRPGNELLITNELAGVGSWEPQRASKHLPVWIQPKKKCRVMTTDWSECSRSCGVGISSRITNKNRSCKLKKETRVCMVRPCYGLSAPAKRGKKCSPVYKASEPLRLSYGKCVSIKLYRPNYCGTCTEQRCCSPQRTRTVPVTFVCRDGARLQMPAMFIQSCKCHNNCGSLNEVDAPPLPWMKSSTMFKKEYA